MPCLPPPFPPHSLTAPPLSVTPPFLPSSSSFLSISKSNTREEREGRRERAPLSALRLGGKGEREGRGKKKEELHSIRFDPSFAALSKRPEEKEQKERVASNLTRAIRCSNATIFRQNCAGLFYRKLRKLKPTFAVVRNRTFPRSVDAQSVWRVVVLRQRMSLLSAATKRFHFAESSPSFVPLPFSFPLLSISNPLSPSLLLPRFA